MEIILASGSPRRRELLARMGLRDFRVEPVDFDEGQVTAPAPALLVEALSRGKGDAAAARWGAQPLILTADTVVALEDTVLGKPKDAAEAVRMLTALSGREHQVYTGFTLRQGVRQVTGHQMTRVVFRKLTAEEIAAYVATGEPMDKAGAYGIQGFGALLVEEIRGDYFNVMGLPLCRVGQVLKDFGIDCLKEAGER